ncbi:MAG TPA: hypothetical protein VNT79_09605 [Phycisphaerae bacterium]|nr:hypothetical protein [Phycisphaerae bacterium]
MPILRTVAIAAVMVLLNRDSARGQIDDASADPRGGVLGACCDPLSEACSIREESICVALGGEFAGDGTTCDACIITSLTINLVSLQDTFELMAPPQATYGYAGGLNVSGSQARNRFNVIMGVTDTWMKFGTQAAVAQFNAQFGPGNWELSSAVLHLSENHVPNNGVFGRGQGSFAIRWLANDNWSEGDGTPQSPGVANGNEVGFTYGRSLLNAVADEVLGTEFENAFTSTWQNFDLPLMPGFTADLMSGGVVSLYFVATDPLTGFTFNSGTHSNAATLILTAQSSNLPCHGDLTGDGYLLGDDLPSFVDDYLVAESLPYEQLDVIDLDDNGTVNAADVSCFVAALLSTHDCAGGNFDCP